MASLLEVTLTASYGLQEMQNVWNYVSDSEVDFTSESQWILEAMGFVPDAEGIFPANTVFGAIRALTTVGVTYLSVFARDVYSVFDFYEIIWSPEPTGQAANPGLSPTQAVGMRTNRSRTDIRRGQKRFSGIPASGSANGGNLQGTTATNAETLANRMEVDLTHTEGGITVTFSPVVVGKQRYNTQTGLPSDTGNAYRYYPTWEEQEDRLSNIGQWSVYPQLRTQTTRQYGRGR